MNLLKKTEPPAKKALGVPIEEQVARYLSGRQTFAQRRRLKKAFNQEYGKAQGYTGAVKNSKVRKLNVLAAKVPAYKVPTWAQEKEASHESSK